MAVRSCKQELGLEEKASPGNSCGNSFFPLTFRDPHLPVWVAILHNNDMVWLEEGPPATNVRQLTIRSLLFHQWCLLSCTNRWSDRQTAYHCSKKSRLLIVGITISSLETKQQDW